MFKHQIKGGLETYIYFWIDSDEERTFQTRTNDY